jgi:hypothetical protein
LSKQTDAISHSGESSTLMITSCTRSIFVHQSFRTPTCGLFRADRNEPPPEEAETKCFLKGSLLLRVVSCFPREQVPSWLDDLRIRDHERF